MRPGTLLRAALSGSRTDLLRVGLTVAGSALAVIGWLAAATVASLGLGGSENGSASWNVGYHSELLQEPGLRPGVITTLVLMTVPVLALLGHCARLGSPARDRRIAAMRLAGASPRQAIAIGAGESGVSAAAGSLLGLAAYLILRRVLDDPDSQGLRTLPTDVLPPAWAIVLVCVLLPLVVAAFSALLLRTVLTSPLGVTRRVRKRRAPRPWPVLLLVVGLVIFGGFIPAIDYFDRHGTIIPARAELISLYAAVLMIALGITLGAGSLSYAIGQAVTRFSNTASARLVGARLTDDPWSGSRTLGVLIVASIFGGGAAATGAYMQAQSDATDAASAAAAADVPGGGDYFIGADPFYTNTVTLVKAAVIVAMVLAAASQIVALTDAVVARRRTYASLVATGVPRGVLARATLSQTLVVAVPALLIATVAGEAMMRLFFGTTVSATESNNVENIQYPSHTVTLAVPIPWAALATTFGLAIAAVALTSGLAALMIRRSTSATELRTA